MGLNHLIVYYKMKITKERFIKNENIDGYCLWRSSPRLRPEPAMMLSSIGPSSAPVDPSASPPSVGHKVSTATPSTSWLLPPSTPVWEALGLCHQELSIITAGVPSSSYNHYPFTTSCHHLFPPAFHHPFTSASLHHFAISLVRSGKWYYISLDVPQGSNMRWNH